MTSQGAKATLAALETGAFDFVLKPSGQSMEANIEHLRRELRTKLAAYARHRSVKQILYGKGGHQAAQAPASPVPKPPTLRRRRAGPPQVVALGISTGGPKALTDMCRSCRPVAGAAAHRAAHAARLHQVAGRRSE